MQKVYLLQLMTVCVGLRMLASHFCHSCQLQVEYNSSLTKVDWLDACIALRVVGACIGCFPPALA
jgi:hypothetical protein